jgi:phosphatidylglycerophosphate synthase
MWLANGLTLARIPLAFGFWVTYGHLGWSLVIVGVAALTDSLDGYFARRARARSGRVQDVRGAIDTPQRSALLRGPAKPDLAIGEWLDPLADKVFVGIALGAAVIHGAPWQLALLVITREVVLVPLAAAYRIALTSRPPVAHAFQADALGKATTILQLAAVVAIVAQLSIAAPLALAAAGLGLIAAAHYVARATAPKAA